MEYENSVFATVLFPEILKCFENVSCYQEFPSQLYLEPHFLLVLFDFVNGKYAMDWSKFVGYVDGNILNTSTADVKLL